MLPNVLAIDWGFKPVYPASQRPSDDKGAGIGPYCLLRIEGAQCLTAGLHPFVMSSPAIKPTAAVT
jgi:hypothetical protein